MLPSTNVRSALLIICTLVATAALAGCQGNQGAVSVRWRIVDLSLGNNYDPKSSNVSDREGACCPNIMNHQCTFDNPWVIHTLTVTLTDPATLASQSATPFVCGIGEETTPFTLPTGTWAIGLTVVSASTGNGQPTTTDVPPPEVHTIVKGDIVNLQVIEIGVNPLPLPGPVPLPGGTQMVTF